MLLFMEDGGVSDDAFRSIRTYSSLTGIKASKLYIFLFYYFRNQCHSMRDIFLKNKIVNVKGHKSTTYKIYIKGTSFTSLDSQ